MSFFAFLHLFAFATVFVCSKVPDGSEKADPEGSAPQREEFDKIDWLHDTLCDTTKGKCNGYLDGLRVKIVGIDPYSNEINVRINVRGKTKEITVSPLNLVRFKQHYQEIGPNESFAILANALAKDQQMHGEDGSDARGKQETEMTESGITDKSISIGNSNIVNDEKSDLFQDSNHINPEPSEKKSSSYQTPVRQSRRDWIDRSPQTPYRSLLDSFGEAAQCPQTPKKPSYSSLSYGYLYVNGREYDAEIADMRCSLKKWRPAEDSTSMTMTDHENEMGFDGKTMLARALLPEFDMAEIEEKIELKKIDIKRLKKEMHEIKLEIAGNEAGFWIMISLIGSLIMAVILQSAYSIYQLHRSQSIPLRHAALSLILPNQQYTLNHMMHHAVSNRKIKIETRSKYN